MAKFLYLANPAKIKSFLAKIQSIGIPTKLTIKEIEGYGFKSKNDRQLLTLMKALDFVSADGKPTEKWKNYRDKKEAGRVLAEGIHKHYAVLFKTYPNAHLESNQTIKDFFRAKTELGPNARKYMLTTFNSLKELAEFKAEKPPEEEPAIQKDKIEPEIPGEEAPSIPRPPSIHIDLQIHISPEAKPEQIDKIFESIAKHFKGFYPPQKAK